jgi:hypothetical protein
MNFMQYVHAYTEGALFLLLLCPTAVLSYITIGLTSACLLLIFYPTLLFCLFSDRDMHVSVVHTRLADFFGTICWLWVFHRARHDGPVLMGWRKPWEHDHHDDHHDDDHKGHH